MARLARSVAIFVAALSTLSGKALAAAPVSTSAHIHERVESLSATMDMVWVLIAATLVMMMQIGFMMLEAGSVRTKNAISVAQKNMLDFAFATIAFATLGFGIAFGTASGWLPIGSDPNLRRRSHRTRHRTRCRRTPW